MVSQVAYGYYRMLLLFLPLIFCLFKHCLITDDVNKTSWLGTLFMASRINTYRKNYENKLQLCLVWETILGLTVGGLNGLTNPNEKMSRSTGNSIRYDNFQ